jgi:cobyrinic acid a,c-diamide synthase
MVGVIPADVHICPRPQGHGYVQVEVTEDNPFFPRGFKYWGHEFHHSALTSDNDLKFCFRMLRGKGVRNRYDGIIYKNVVAAYTHLHSLGVPSWAEVFITLAEQYKSQTALHSDLRVVKV